jgi:hypothetical protein
MLIELLAVMALGGPAVATARGAVLMPADGGLPQVASTMDGGMSSPVRAPSSRGAIAKADLDADGGY